MNRMPSKEQVEYIRERYPAGTRVILHAMGDPQAPPPGTGGTVVYVDDAGQIGVRWDSGSSLALIPGVDSFSRESAQEKNKLRRPQGAERRRRMRIESRKRPR